MTHGAVVGGRAVSEGGLLDGEECQYGDGCRAARY